MSDAEATKHVSIGSSGSRSPHYSEKTVNASDRRFWPFRPRASMIAAVVLLVVLFLVLAIMRANIGWPTEKSESVLLIGVLLLSLSPVVLALLDIIIERGGSIEYKGAKIDFSQVHELGTSGITIPANIGVRGQAVTDSSTVEILDALRQATACDTVIIDLEEGQAWWETRLLVLLAGAERLGRPHKVVFVGTDAGKQYCFQGWAHPADLLRPLLRADRQYVRSLNAARAAAKQWELAGPLPPPVAGTPPQAPWMQGLAVQYPWMAFDATTGLPNELLTEQLMAADLGSQVELQAGSRSISLVRLEELFKPVLNKDNIDQSWSNDRQISAFFYSSAEYIALTQNKTYVTLVSRLMILDQIVRSMLEQPER